MADDQMPPVRVQLRRTKGWRMPANTVKVCRPSPWGNPYRVGRFRTEGPYAKDVEVTPADAVKWFRSDIMNPDGEALRARARKELRGRNLACWCGLDQPCHADVWLEVANA